ncbi:hypothetical protein D6764_02205 [Candidatus Woesearchaeota archaeon]|nr:MAG: hypothetical protein D6764_02205 [Candidatus Woesearchaeota archaeon]
MKKTLIGLAMLFIFASSVIAADWYVDDDSSTYPSPDFTSIQDAINAASDGDVIYVADGNYPEKLVINKELQIHGESTDGTVIDASSFSGYGITLSSDNTVLSDFTLIGPATEAPTSYGIKVSGVENIGIYRVKILNSGRTGLDLHGVSDVEVGDAESSFNKGAGISVTDSESVVINNAVTTGNSWGGIALFTSGAYYPPGGSDDITITGHDSNLELIGMYKEETPGLEVTNLYAPQYVCSVRVIDPLPPNFNYFTWYFESEADADDWVVFLTENGIDRESIVEECNQQSEIPEFTGIGVAATLLGSLAIGLGKRIKKKRA